jgi:hypothetical protein
VNTEKCNTPSQIQKFSSCRTKVQDDLALAGLTVRDNTNQNYIQKKRWMNVALWNMHLILQRTAYAVYLLSLGMMTEQANSCSKPDFYFWHS